MKLANLKTAMAEAERFITRAKSALAAHHVAVDPLPGYEEQARQHPVKDLHNYNPRENGALRRASMDLTRALAELRKPD